MIQANKAKAYPKRSVASPALKPPRGILQIMAKSPSSSAPATLRDMAIAGLPNSDIRKLATQIDLDDDQLSLVVGVPKGRLRKLTGNRKLDPATSDRLIRYAHLFALTCEVMGDKAIAQHWFKSPQRALGGESPLVYAMTEFGAREVENLLGRIEHSVYS